MKKNATLTHSRCRRGNETICRCCCSAYSRHVGDESLAPNVTGARSRSRQPLNGMRNKLALAASHYGCLQMMSTSITSVTTASAEKRHDLYKHHKTSFFLFLYHRSFRHVLPFFIPLSLSLSHYFSFSLISIV